MHEKMIALCAAVGAAGAVVAEALGGWDDAVFTLVMFMGADFVLGLLCALIFRKSAKTANGGLSSSVCAQGVVRKVGTLIIVVVAHYVDVLIGGEYVRNAVVIAFCAAELISICETAGLMGILPKPVQAILNKAIDILKNREGDK